MAMVLIKIFGNQRLLLHNTWDEASTDFNPKQAGGTESAHRLGFRSACAETVSSRKLKRFDVYYILIGLNSEYKPVP